MKKKLFMLHLAIISILCLAGCNGFNNSKSAEDTSVMISMEKGRGAAISHREIATYVVDPMVRRGEELLEEMSLSEKISQMFFIHYTSESVETLKEHQFGGVILFANFFKGKSKEQVISDIAAMQEVSELPMLVGVDEEGGTVVRVSSQNALSDHKFQSPQALFQQGGMERIAQDAKEKSELLKSLGINVNLAPVADVSESSGDYIYKRTFGKSADETAEYVATVVEQMDACQMGSVLKHFPGYGNNKDTHKQFTYDKRPYSQFTEVDFIPFKRGIEAGADSVLVSHNVVTCMDETLPASLSPKVHEILRNDMCFDGVVMTDDLVMDAIADTNFGENPAVLSVLAGNDMIIATRYDSQMAAIKEAVEQGVISEEQIDEAVLRILKWKMELGLIEIEGGQ